MERAREARTAPKTEPAVELAALLVLLTVARTLRTIWERELRLMVVVKVELLMTVVTGRLPVEAADVGALEELPVAEVGVTVGIPEDALTTARVARRAKRKNTILALAFIMVYC